MPAYMIGDVTVKDNAAYAQYRTAASDLLAKHHGRYVVRGAECEVVQGNWRPKRLIIVEFPSKVVAREYLSDPEYHRLSALRESALQSEIVLVEGAEERRAVGETVTKRDRRLRQETKPR